jgi:DNA-binding transcriptional regulator YiaG
MTKQEFKEIRQLMKLRGVEIAKRLGKITLEVLAYETGTASIPKDVAKYMIAFKKQGE